MRVQIISYVEMFTNKLLWHCAFISSLGMTFYTVYDYNTFNRSDHYLHTLYFQHTLSNIESDWEMAFIVPVNPDRLHEGHNGTLRSSIQYKHTFTHLLHALWNHYVVFLSVTEVSFKTEPQFVTVSTQTRGCARARWHGTCALTQSNAERHSHHNNRASKAFRGHKHKSA